MLCEKCGLNPATVKVTQIINGQKTFRRLCPECAKNDEIFKGLSLGFGGILSPLAIGRAEEKDEPCCPLCKMPLSEFLSGGKLGCGECYSVFEAQAAPLLKRIHATNVHVGKLPKGASGQSRAKRKIDLLKNQLKEAITAEEYEKAARLRDEIKEMEGLS